MEMQLNRSILALNDDSTMPTIDIVSLYPQDMNIYGDFGNVLVIQQRLRCYGYRPIIHEYNQGDSWPANVDIVLAGGGQDAGQKKIFDDLHRRADILHECAENDVPMLMICGMYQLFGHYFETVQGERIKGISIFDATTIAGDTRMIGNLTEKSEQFGSIVGYENHSGQTWLGNVQPLGEVTHAQYGNNGKDLTEGARYRNVIGTYMHGSLLPKNPLIADFLVRTAVEHHYGEFTPTGQANLLLLQQYDTIAEQARTVAMQRPR